MLNDKQEKFVVAYIANGGNATQAALAAGYSKASAYSQGCRLLKHDEVSTVIDQRRGKVMRKLEISAERVLEERARLAFYDPAKLLGVTTVEQIQSLDEDTRRAIQGFRVGAGGEVEIKAADKDKSLTALEKHLGLYDDTKGAGILNITINL